MGATSSCCGAQEAPETELDLSPGVPRISKSPRGGEGSSSARRTSNGAEAPPAEDAMKEPTDDGMESFMTRLEEGIAVFIILQDKSRLKCKVKLATELKSLILTCGPKVRTISLADIKAVLHTVEQLNRVENAAGIGANEPCAAVHLMTGNCIPLFFISEDDKRRFVRAIATSQKEIKAIDE